ncbi:MAG: redoxin family protein [Acidobacteriota bacterium]|nr:redoxin family protein [Acidobacteriota bacterium]
MRNWIFGIISVAALAMTIPVSVVGQPKTAIADSLPVVVKVDDVSIRPLLKPDGKPLLVNFWATWCVPCVEEFPILVALDGKYKGKIDFITISLDDLAEINRDVPKFLKEQNATMPAYLLWTKDENAVISSISKDLSGGLPLTLLFGRDGSLLYARQGLVKPEVLTPLIDKSIEMEECKPPDAVSGVR